MRVLKNGDYDGRQLNGSAPAVGIVTDRKGRAAGFVKVYKTTGRLWQLLQTKWK